MELKYHPCVFCVEDNYQILLLTDKPAIARIYVSGKEYNDAFNGVYPTEQSYHKITVPAKALNAAKCYTVSLIEMVHRKPYFPILGSKFEKTWSFDPVPENRDIKAYIIADSHSVVDEPVYAAQTFCYDPDILFFNGDIANNADTFENILTLPRIADKLIKGHKPVVFARGNHDTRGAVASLLGEYTGVSLNKSYFSFRLGSLWGLVLDCGEDKADSHEEYNGTICMSNFRKEQISFLHNILETKPYEDEGITHRICLCHIPFTRNLGNGDPFGIEKEVYNEWTSCLNKIGINAMMSGHDHVESIIRPGDEHEDLFGQKFPTLVLSKFTYAKDGNSPYYMGAGLTFSHEGLNVQYTDCLGNKSEKIHFHNS